MREDPQRALSAERQRLLDVIEQHPGVHLRALQRRTAMGWGTFSYHLAVLMRAGAVHVARQGKHALVYARGARPRSDASLLALQGAAADIYEDLSVHGGSTQAHIQARLGISRQLIAYHLRRLEDQGLVRADRGRPKIYRCSAGA